MKDPSPPMGRRASGFSLVELLTVVAIIGIMVAVALPALSNYLKLYRIRGAAQQVAGEIQTARLKAISYNTEFGVVFVALSPNTYRWVIQDNVNGVLAAAPTAVSVQLLNAAQVGPVRTLPLGVQFGAGRVGGECKTAGMGAVSAHSLRFSRLGTWCDSTPPGTATCPPDDTAYANQFANSQTGTVICVTQPARALERAVIVTPAGGTRTAP